MFDSSEGIGEPLPGDREIKALAAWSDLRRLGISLAALVQFHTRNKFLILAHSEPCYRQMGPLVARAAGRPLAVVAEHYGALLHEALSTPSTEASHANVLHHLAGFFKEEPPPVRDRVRAAVAAFVERRAPLEEARDALREAAHHVGARYVLEQSYLATAP